MKMQKYFAELLATFTLTFAVLSSVAVELAVPTPLLAALVVGVFVYTIGPISGAHINPAVTVAVWVLKKIDGRDAGLYILAQVLGAAVAFGLAKLVFGFEYAAGLAVFDWKIVVGEVLGAFILMFGISSVVIGKVKAEVSGLVIGGSLLVGLMLVGGMSNAILNPAVALGVGTVSVAHILGPIVGTVLGALAYKGLKS